MVLLAVPVALLAEMVGWRESPEPDWFAAVLYGSVVVGLLAVGALAGWRGMVVFVPAYVFAALFEEAVVYEPPVSDCDPFCDSPTFGLPLGVLFGVVLIGVGMAGRRAVKSITTR